MKWLVVSELHSVINMIEALSNLDTSELSLGPAAIYDCNGDVVGHVGTTDSGDIGFILQLGDDE